MESLLTLAESVYNGNCIPGSNISLTQPSSREQIFERVLNVRRAFGWNPKAKAGEMEHRKAIRLYISHLVHMDLLVFFILNY